MSDLGSNLDQQSFHARADRRFTQGQVVAIDPVAGTVTLDVGATDVNGAPVYLHDVPFQRQTPPAVGDNLTLHYGNASPHSAQVGGADLSGQNPPGSLQVVGAVTSIAASGGAALQGAIEIVGAGTVSVSESGHTITVTGSATVGVSALNSLTGAVTLAAGTNVGVSVAGNTITISASGGGGGAPTWPLTVLASGTTAYTALDSDVMIWCYSETTAVTVTLPDAAGRAGRRYEIFDAYQGSTQGITVAATSPATVVGISSIRNNAGTARRSVTYVSDGTNWHSVVSSANS